MSNPLSRTLLALASAVREDGGEAVRRTLRNAVAEAVPFDVGELVIRESGRLARWGLGPHGEGEGLAPLDLLEGVWSVGAALRFDDWEEMAAFSEARDRLRARDLRSLLVLPLVPPDRRMEGALLVARHQGWAFVGAPMPVLLPLSGMAAVALSSALVVTEGRRRVEALEAGLSAGGSDTEVLRRELMASREQREAALRTLGEARERLQAVEAAAGEKEARLGELAAGRDSLRAETDAARAEVGRLAAERDALRGELAKGRDDLESAWSERAGARAEAEAARTRRDVALAEVRERELLVAELEVRVEELLALASAPPAGDGEEAARLREQAARLEAEAESLRRELLSARGDVARAQAALSDSRSAREAALARCRELEDKVQELVAAPKPREREVDPPAAAARRGPGRTRPRKRKPSLPRPRSRRPTSR